jgi:cytochrome c oxidase assembly protein subunit 15
MVELNNTVGPLAQLALLGSLVATVPLVWWRQRSRGVTPSQRLRALTLLTLFLTFDLIVFGAFTRLTDSGLGCPDWPGCYGQASPIAAHADIQAAQTALPTGPVTHGKAWVEMIHRYLASAVGVLCIGLCLLSWRLRRSALAAASPAPSPWWATLTLVWICVQGAFGALTVTMKLFPAIVSLHLLFGLGLLMLLAWQAEAYEPQPLLVPGRLRALVPIAFLLLLAQVALGGWVSTNYAVLACDEFPTCHGGAFWPMLDFDSGFRLWRELGSDGAGGWIGFAALAAIHVAHRLGALAVILVLAGLAGGLWRAGQQGWARLIVALLLWQFLSGLSNVVLDWPLVAALAHSGGAAALLAVLVTLFARVRAGASAPRP